MIERIRPTPMGNASIWLCGFLLSLDLAGAHFVHAPALVCEIERAVPPTDCQPAALALFDSSPATAPEEDLDDAADLEDDSDDESFGKSCRVSSLVSCESGGDPLAVSPHAAGYGSRTASRSPVLRC